MLDKVNANKIVTLIALVIGWATVGKVNTMNELINVLMIALIFKITYLIVDKCRRSVIITFNKLAEYFK